MTLLSQCPGSWVDRQAAPCPVPSISFFFSCCFDSFIEETYLFALWSFPLSGFGLKNPGVVINTFFSPLPCEAGVGSSYNPILKVLFSQILLRPLFVGSVFSLEFNVFLAMHYVCCFMCKERTVHMHPISSPFSVLFSFISFIHMCIQCSGHFFPLPSSVLFSIPFFHPFQ
jgi:hypothetical protein